MPHQDPFREVWSIMHPIFPCLPTSGYEGVGGSHYDFPRLIRHISIFCLLFQGRALSDHPPGRDRRSSSLILSPVRHSLCEWSKEWMWQKYLSNNWIQTPIPHTLRDCWRSLSPPLSSASGDKLARTWDCSDCVRLGVGTLGYNKISPEQ